MTYKHVKFQDSPTMRALEKVALDKGLISLETMTKTASAEKPDYTPSENLMENVMKLCGGLRELGFEKQANELEGKFVDYKRAFNAYETSKEKGEDLVDAAHPEGSHDLVGVEGDATIETIVDQHLKNVKLVEKTPTGKLSSVRDIIGAVKVVLADDRSNMMNTVHHNTSRILEEFTKVLSFISKEINLSMKFLPQLQDLLSNPTVENLEHAKDWIIYSNNVIKQYVSETTWNSIVKSNIFAKMISFIQPSIDLVRKVSDIDAGAGAQQLNPELKPKVPETTPIKQVDSFEEQLKKIISTLNVWKTLVNIKPDAKPAGKKQAIDWLSAKESRLQILLKQYSSVKESDRIEYAATFKQSFDSIVNEPNESLADFKKVWIG